MDLCDPVLEGSALDLILDLAIPQSAFKSDELPLLERLGELREIAPRIDAMPFGAVLVIPLVVLPVLLVIQRWVTTNADVARKLRKPCARRRQRQLLLWSASR
jgi:hypothetical protein